MAVEQSNMGTSLRLAAASMLAAATLSVWIPSAIAQTDTLEEVIVTARYRQETLQTTPIAITAITAEDLEVRNLDNVDDLGLIVPNAYFRQPISNFGPTQTIGLRGLIQVDFNYAFEPTVGIYIDDVYHGTLTGSSMDLTDLERVEVLRGPQGTLFGKNTMGGAVRLISKKPQGDGSGSIEATYGDRNRIDVRGVADLSLIPEKLFARISGVSKQQDGYGKRLDFTCEMIRRGTPELAGRGDGLGAGPTVGSAPVAVPVGSPADLAFSFPQVIDPRQGSGCELGALGGSTSSGAKLMLRYLPTQKLEIGFAGEFSNVDSDPPVETALNRRGTPSPFDGDVRYDTTVIYPRYGIRYTADNRFVTGNNYTNYATYGNAVDGTSYDPNTHLKAWGVSGTVDYDINGKTHLKLISSYRTYETTWINDSDLMPFEVQQTNYLQEHDQFQAEAQLSGVMLDDNLEWTTGVFYYDSTSRAYNTANFVTFGLVFVADDGFTSENQSAFLHLNYKLTDRLALSGGLRYSDESKTNNFRHYGLVPPKLVEFGEGRVDYKMGLDFQATDDLFVYSQVATGFQSAGVTPRVFTVGQIRSLPGEEVINYEIGAKVQLLDKTLRINTAVFYMDYSKRLITSFATQCNLANDLDPGPPYFLAGGTCPAGTPAQFTNGSLWFLYQNSPGTVEGFEVEVSAFPAQNLAIDASVGYNKFKGDEKDRSNPTFRDESALLQPEWNASAGVQYAFELGSAGRITPRLDYFYQSHRTNGIASQPQRDPDDIIPGYGLYNARLSYDTADEGWQVALTVSNLFDKFYWQQLGSATDRNTGAVMPARQGTPGRPREWAVTVKRNF